MTSTHAPATPLAYSYVRFSRPEQARGDSLRRQVDAARAYASGLGLELDETLRDLGRSAFRGEHRSQGALGSFLREVEAGRVPPGSVLIVESLDRLSREAVLEALDQLRAILDKGVEVVTLTDGQHYTAESIRKEFTQLLVSLLVMARAHEESARKGERVAAAWSQKRARAAGGEAMTARCVAWCRVVGTGRERRHELVPEKADVVRQIFLLAADGMGRRQITVRLNKEGVAPFGRTKGWQDSYVEKILANRSVMGLFRPGRKTSEGRVLEAEEVAGYYPAVIDEALFHRAAAARRGRARTGGPVGKTLPNLFSGLARCGGCGATMVHLNKGAPPKGGRYLACDNHRRGLACSNPKPYVPYSRVESTVLVGVFAIDWLQIEVRRERTEAPAEEIARLKLRGADAGKEIARLLESFGTGSPIPQVADRVRALNEEVRAAAGRVRELEDIVLSGPPGWAQQREAYERLLAEMKTAEGDELLTVRSRIAQGLRRVIGKLEFKSDAISVFTVDGRLAHRFLPSPMPVTDEMLKQARERRAASTFAGADD